MEDSGPHQSGTSTPNRTPGASRSYLNMHQSFHHHTPAHSAESHRLMQDISEVASDNRGVIYGTSIDTQDVLVNLERFIREFELMIEVSMGNHKERIPRRIYMEDLKSLLLEEERTVLNVMGSHIKEFDR